MSLRQPRRSLRPRRRRRRQPAVCDERPDTIISGRGAGGNDVRYRTPADRDSHLLTALNSSKRLAQRTLQVADTDLTHVVTVAPMWSSPVTTPVTTSTPSNASNASTDSDVLEDLDAIDRSTRAALG
jgi:hypothetical protein